MVEDNKTTYLVQKRKEDKKWEVKLINGSKAIKLFDTKAEADEYVKELAKNNDRGILNRASKGDKKGKFH